MVGVSPTCHQRGSSYLHVGFRVDPREADHERPCFSGPVNILKLQGSNRKKTNHKHTHPPVLTSASFPRWPGLLVSYNAHRAPCRVGVRPWSSGNRSPLSYLCSPYCFTWEGWGLGGCSPGKLHLDLFL